MFTYMEFFTLIIAVTGLVDLVIKFISFSISLHKKKQPPK